MAEAKIYLSGYLDVPEDRREAVADALPHHIELTRAEPGCLSFEVVLSDDIPGAIWFRKSSPMRRPSMHIRAG
ncbi:antibiotic biosynthesis monooxygenase family protein [Agrobacterium sp. SORGH_AS 787]|uniref:putative quinol monooxygenase n=1 Tax=Agrobacterium sp. SORGH_AS 787 TaxID=3041775 RepID=UPI002784B917|nr:quinol monooxygenase YgiN [Rhizobium sp. SORGH_AS_0787]